jgi:amidohydrolase
VRSSALVLSAGIALTLIPSHSANAQRASISRYQAEIARRTTAALDQVVAWRRDFHEHPELSGSEVRTAGIVAKELQALGLEVRTGVGGTGIVGVLRGGKPGPTVALRADMDGLPVTELVDIPFRSKVRATYNGQEVGVMHACGHDTHVAMLLGAAQVLSGMKAQLAGNVVFVFQPAEEGHPEGGGGAERMIRDGALENPKVDAVFGLHVFPGPAGTVMYRPGPVMAASNAFTVVIHGKQTHGARPWSGVDPIVVGSQVVLGLQTIVSRQTDITAVPAIVTVGAMNGGVRNNIIPDSIVLVGTIRTFEKTQRDEIFARVARTAEQIAASAGARAQVKIDSGYPVTRNDSALTTRMLPSMVSAVGAENVWPGKLETGAEDFSYFQERVPGVFVFLGITPRDQDWRAVPVNHSPLFFADESALPYGVRLLATFATDFLSNR